MIFLLKQTVQFSDLGGIVGFRVALECSLEGISNCIFRSAAVDNWGETIIVFIVETFPLAPEIVGVARLQSVVEVIPASLIGCLLSISYGFFILGSHTTSFKTYGAITWSPFSLPYSLNVNRLTLQLRELRSPPALFKALTTMPG